MKKHFLSFILGCTVTAILTTSTITYAETMKTIDAIFGKIKLVVDGQQMDKETLLYEGTTYIPLRAAAEAFGKEVDYDHLTETAYINSPKVEVNINTSQTVNNNILILKSADLNNQVSKDEIKDKFTVFWGTTGNKIHLVPDCRTFVYEVYYGTLEEAKEVRTDGWCGVCSNGMTDEKFLLNGNPKIKENTQQLK